MAAEPTRKHAPARAMRLDRFDRALADLVASWPHGKLETRWMAPATPPPMTGKQVLAWQGSGREQLLLRAVGAAQPVGYGELNELRNRRAQYWLGHLIVDPAQRGKGFGTLLTRLLLWRAFHQRQAKRVTLVVFPENERAIAGYRSAGMWTDGCETHAFPAYRDEVRLLRMVATRQTWTG